jgi:hypothetical protein
MAEEAVNTIEFIPRDLYRSYDHAFRDICPQWLRDHRKFFEAGRGYGESAFHAAWLDVLGRDKPKNLLEIGVYRGQSISLWQLIANKLGLEMFIVGITPLTNIGDSVSNYVDLDYKCDIQSNFREFNLGNPRLVNSLSTEKIALDFIASIVWDLIYIDGSHDYEVVEQDYLNSIKNLRQGGLLCMDDSSLYLGAFLDGVFKGHDGPSRVVRDFAIPQMNYEFTVGHLNFFRKR